jgi:hypothetical protein
MELIHRVMPKDHTIIMTSCWHSGSSNCHKDGILELVDKVKSRKNYFMGHHGDMIEAIVPGDKRYCSSSIDVSTIQPDKQRDWIIETCRPIANKILFFQIGNHEFKLINTTNIAHDICMSLNVPYGALMCKFVATDRDGKVLYKWFAMHGKKGLPKGAKDSTQRRGNRAAALKRILEETGHCDCILMSQGHDHSALMVVPPSISDEVSVIDDGRVFKELKHTSPPQNSQFIPPEARWYAICGSMRKTLAPPGSGVLDYAELAGYGPSPLGWVEARIENGVVVDVQALRL